MKKKYIIYFLLALLIGVGIFFAYKYYMERPGNPTEIKMKEQGLISSLEEFVSLITFEDGGRITMEKSEGFDYVLPGERDIYHFSPSRFYEKNQKREDVLRKKIAFFLKARELGGTVRTLKEAELPDTLKVHNQLHIVNADGENEFKKVRDGLEAHLKDGTITKDQMTQLSYIYTLEGDYEKTSALDAKNCRKNKERCTRTTEIVVKGTVRDQKGRLVSGASVYVLNYPNELPRKTNEKGVFNFKVKTKYPEKIRLRVSKNSYASAYNDFYVLSGGKGQERNLEFVINQSQGTVVVDTKNPKISVGDKGDVVKVAKIGKGVFTIQTNVSTYKIPYNAIVTEKGKVFKGKASIYVYEFDRSSNIENLLRVDARSSREGKIWLGRSLVTFGMPYLQIFAVDSGEELFIDQSNPAKIHVKIPEMQALRKGDPTVGYKGLTTKDLEKLVAYSARSKTGITRQYLLDNDLAQFPIWWMLDQKRGIWDTVPFRLLDTDGLLEASYYSIYLKKNKR